METAAPSPSSSPSTSTPAAPAPASTAATTTPSAASGATKPAAAGGSSPARGPDGKFLPRSGEPAAETPNQDGPPETAAQRRIRLKVDGREEEFDEERVKAFAEMGLAGKKRFTELDQQRKEFEAGRKELAEAETPEQFLAAAEKIGMPKDRALSLAYQLLSSTVSEQEMTPEQRAQAEFRREREAFEAEKRQQAESAAAEEQKQHETQYLTILNEHAQKALEAVGLPMVGPAADAFAGHLREAVEAMGLTPESIRYAAEAARDDLRETHRALTSSLKGRALVDFLGPEVEAEMRRYAIEQWKASRAQQGTPPPSKLPAPEPKPAGPRFLSERELRDLQRAKGLR